MPPGRNDPADPRAWLRRARSNLARARVTPPQVLYEDLCFDAQQAAEKAIKAVLGHRAISFPKTHDLNHLLSLAARNGIDIPGRCETPHLSPDAEVTDQRELRRSDVENQRRLSERPRPRRVASNLYLGRDVSLCPLRGGGTMRSQADGPFCAAAGTLRSVRVAGLAGASGDTAARTAAQAEAGAMIAYPVRSGPCASADGGVHPRGDRLVKAGGVDV